MAIERWDPVRDIMRLQNDMASVFGRAFGNDALDVGTRMWAPALDVYEQEDAFVLTAELPGVEHGDIEVTLEDGTLSIRGERRFYDKVEEDKFRRIERRFGQFQRTVALPGRLDADRIEAAYRDGILTVTVPKAEEAKPKRIAVTTA